MGEQCVPGRRAPHSLQRNSLLALRLVLLLAERFPAHEVLLVLDEVRGLISDEDVVARPARQPLRTNNFAWLACKPVALHEAWASVPPAENGQDSVWTPTLYSRAK
jgi:hypothetical protein